MTPAAKLTVPAQPEYVGLARLVVAQAARQAGMAQGRVQDVKIAVDEALANAVRAQAGLAAPAAIEVSFGAGADGFEVVVRGPDPDGADPDGAVEPGPALLDPKLSFMLIEGLTDDMSYVADGSTMCLRFVIGLGDAGRVD
jgi:serine/threonine-protein kinase RsbW